MMAWHVETFFHYVFTGDIHSKSWGWSDTPKLCQCHTSKLIGLLFQGTEQELGIRLKGANNGGEDLIFFDFC